MATLMRIAESLDLDLDRERWLCARCGREIGPARENFKHGLLVHERDPREVHRPLIEGPYSFAPNPDWIRVLEFYCPGCGVQVETEYLPPGHPITNTTEIDIDSLKARLARGEIVLEDGRMKVAEPGERAQAAAGPAGSRSKQTEQP